MILPQTEGLLFAAGCSITNVGMDVAQKRALTQRPLIATLLVGRVIIFGLLTLFVLLRAFYGHPAPWTVLLNHGLLRSAAFVSASALDCVLVALSGLLYYRSIQRSALSLTIPYLTFTPAFLLLSQYMILRERCTLLQALAVGVILYGSWLLNRVRFHLHWSAPFRALVTEPASRYMLLAAFLLSVTNVLDQWLIRRSDSVTFAWLYSAGLALILLVVWALRAKRWSSLATVVWGACAVAGATDACALQLQFEALRFLSPVVVVSFKRSGVLLSLLAGWLYFHERDALGRLPAACVMLTGALMLYLRPSPGLQVSLGLLAIALGAASTHLVTRPKDMRGSPS